MAYFGHSKAAWKVSKEKGKLWVSLARPHYYPAVISACPARQSCMEGFQGKSGNDQPVIGFPCRYLGLGPSWLTPGSSRKTISYHLMAYFGHSKAAWKLSKEKGKMISL